MFDYQYCILCDLIWIKVFLHFNFSQDWFGLPYSDFHPLQPLRLENFLHLRQLVPHPTNQNKKRLIPERHVKNPCLYHFKTVRSKTWNTYYRTTWLNRTESGTVPGKWAHSHQTHWRLLSPKEAVTFHQECPAVSYDCLMHHPYKAFWMLRSQHELLEQVIRPAATKDPQQKRST